MGRVTAEGVKARMVQSWDSKSRTHLLVLQGELLLRKTVHLLAPFRLVILVGPCTTSVVSPPNGTSDQVPNRPLQNPVRL